VKLYVPFFLASSALALGCVSMAEDDLDETELVDGDDAELGTASAALTTPAVLELINTCDSSPVRLVAATNNKFVLDPGNGSQIFKARLTGIKLVCAVGVRFNVPAGHRARLGQSTTFGEFETNSFPTGAVFTNQTGFTANRRPATRADTQFGPSVLKTQFLPKLSTGTVDVQHRGADPANALLVTECGAPNTWFYVRPSIDSGAAAVDLDGIVSSFKLEPCP